MDRDSKKGCVVKFWGRENLECLKIMHNRKNVSDKFHSNVSQETHQNHR